MNNFFTTTIHHIQTPSPIMAHQCVFIESSGNSTRTKSSSTLIIVKVIANNGHLLILATFSYTDLNCRNWRLIYFYFVAGFMDTSPWYSYFDSRGLHLYKWSKIPSQLSYSSRGLDSTSKMGAEARQRNLWMPN